MCTHMHVTRECVCVCVCMGVCLCLCLYSIRCPRGVCHTLIRHTVIRMPRCCTAQYGCVCNWRLHGTLTPRSLLLRPLQLASLTWRESVCVWCGSPRAMQGWVLATCQWHLTIPVRPLPRTPVCVCACMSTTCLAPAALHTTLTPVTLDRCCGLDVCLPPCVCMRVCVQQLFFQFCDSDLMTASWLLTVNEGLYGRSKSCESLCACASPTAPRSKRVGVCVCVCVCVCSAYR